MDEPPKDWVETALRVTGHFEDSEDPLGAVSGDFDGMGISLGVLQWNIGSGSLQPLILPLGLARVLETMPVYGRDLWDACNGNVQHGLSVCRSWQTGATLRKPVLAELKAFTGAPAFVERQIARATRVASSAFSTAKAYAASDPAYGNPTKGLFCWFFDVFTQNGGLKDLDYDDVRGFIAHNGLQRVDDVICDWLATRTDASAGYRDSRSNAALWRDQVPQERLSLLVLSFLRSQLARLEYRGDVLNRKAAIAIGRGWVHRELHDLTKLLA